MKTLEDWKPVSIGHLVDLINGFAFPSEGFTDGDGMPLIRIRDLNSHDTEVNFHGKYSARYVVKMGDLLIGMDGDFVTVKWKGNDALLNQRVCKLVTKNRDFLDQEFLFYRISDEIIKIHRITAATTVKHLSSKDILEIDLPCKLEQVSIVAILSTVDCAIEQTEALIAKQERIRAGLAQDLFTRGIDEHGNLRSESTHKFEDSAVGRVPAGWEVESLSRRASVKGGKRLPAGHPYSEGDTGYRYLRTMDFIGKRLDYYSLNHLSPNTFRLLERYEIENGNIFISIAGVNLGVAGVFRSDFDERTILTENAAKICLVTDDVPEYLALQLNGLSVQQQIIEVKGVGAGVPKLALFRIHQLAISWPSKEEQMQIVQRLDHLENCIAEQKEALAKLRAVKIALMQDLLTGKKRVMA